jgi:transcriptional regulator with XRE-family HTH domain
MPSTRIDPFQEEDAQCVVALQDLGRAIRRVRQAKHLTIAAAARKAGMSAGHLGVIERGRGNPRLETLFGLVYATLRPHGSRMTTMSEDNLTPACDAIKNALRANYGAATPGDWIRIEGEVGAEAGRALDVLLRDGSVFSDHAGNLRLRHGASIEPKLA